MNFRGLEEVLVQ